MRSLDEQVQEIKADVLGIAAELRVLEEQLLFPSSTQVTVFVTFDQPAGLRLDAVQLLIDDEVAAHHIYDFQELDALHKGGVQKLYTGNLTRGEHRLTVQVIGKLDGERDFREVSTFTFNKDVDPRLLSIELAGPASGKEAVHLETL